MGRLNLNIGCGGNLQEGFANHDRKPAPHVDFASDLETEQLHGVASGAWDCVLASHVLEHIANLIPLMRDIHRVLKPGGHLIAVTPYASSNDAVEDPTHVRFFTEASWYYFDRRLYERTGHAGNYDSPVDFSFDVLAVSLVPYQEFLGDPELDWKMKHWRNIIREVQAVLRKVA